jgi:hypothetical protein
MDPLQLHVHQTTQLTPTPYVRPWIRQPTYAYESLWNRIYRLPNIFQHPSTVETLATKNIKTEPKLIEQWTYDIQPSSKR